MEQKLRLTVKLLIREVTAQGKVIIQFRHLLTTSPFLSKPSPPYLCDHDHISCKIDHCIYNFVKKVSFDTIEQLEHGRVVDEILQNYPPEYSQQNIVTEMGFCLKVLVGVCSILECNLPVQHYAMPQLPLFPSIQSM